tara:strand:- start:1246 stop:2100 length:855 start_codon:yes stop_codon:yes gene_type:complete
MNNATIYCLCLNNKILHLVKNLDYVPVGLGNDNFSNEWTRDNTLKNISFKNKYYGEYTFHYWFWKNLLPKVADNHWIGFCAHKDFWCNKKEIKNDPAYKINQEKVPSAILKNKSNLKDIVLREIPSEWEKYDTVIGNHHYINNIKFSKLIKHGLYSLARNPSALFKTKRNIRFHFDMWHGNGNLDKAIELLNDNDREDFRKYTNENVSFSRGNMFVCRSKKIINDFYNSIFPWLESCEKIFGFNLDGYGKTRIYAFLAERYMSYWFEKYTKPLLWPVIFYDINK